MKTRFETVIHYLQLSGMAKNVSEIAEKIGTSRTNISAAKNGSLPPASALRLLHRINAAYGNPFSTEYIETGEGSPIVGNYAANIGGDDQQTTIPSEFTSLLKTSQEQIDTLLAQQAEFLRIITNLTNK